MSLTVQQFDLIASHQGIQAALAVAEQYGGVTGSREAAVSAPPPATVGGQPITSAAAGMFGGDLFGTGPVSGWDAPAIQTVWGGPTAPATQAAQEGPAAPTEGQTIKAWINELITGRTGLGINAEAVNPVTTESLIKSLSAKLGRVISAAEFNAAVLPSIPQEWQPRQPSGFSTAGSIANGGQPISGGTPWNPAAAGGGATGVAGTTGILGGGGGNVNILGDDLGTGGVTPLQMTRPSLEFQPQEDIYRRVGQERFGPRTALQGEIVNRLGNQYDALRPILEFGPDASRYDRAAGFRKFLNSPRPTGQQLGQDLAKIMATGGSDLIEGSFTDEDINPTNFNRYRPALKAGLQPLMQDLSPFVQAGVARAIEDRFRQMFANDPTQFQGAGDVFRGLQSRKYLPTWGG